jgi:hypothetical protein
VKRKARAHGIISALMNGLFTHGDRSLGLVAPDSRGVLSLVTKIRQDRCTGMIL